MLCGDAHLAGHTTVSFTGSDPPNTPHILHILHAPALYAPFPFANGQPHDYRCEDEARWMTASDRYVCRVRSQLWPLGDGFVRVSAAKSDVAWHVEAHFDTGSQTGRMKAWRVI